MKLCWLNAWHQHYFHLDQGLMPWLSKNDTLDCLISQQSRSVLQTSFWVASRKLELCYVFDKEAWCMIWAIRVTDSGPSMSGWAVVLLIRLPFPSRWLMFIILLHKHSHVDAALEGRESSAVKALVTSATEVAHHLGNDCTGLWEGYPQCEHKMAVSTFVRCKEIASIARSLFPPVWAG